MPISEVHKQGIRDLLVGNEANIPALIQMVKSTTKCVCKTEDASEALDILVTHVGDTYKLLSKRSISKEMLFTYLNKRQPGVATDFTKADLVSKVIAYWEREREREGEVSTPQAAICPPDNEETYPIHIMARKFGEWFFERLNQNSLSLPDLWTDASLHLRIQASDGAQEVECSGAAEVLDTLTHTKQQFGFIFNPNLTHAGVQGRMNAYGHVMVLACGTLHTELTSVGVFECAFGLVQDPRLKANWKPKHFKFLLKSELRPPEMHRLTASETLQEALELPAPSDDLDD
ncbi:hypothetical protein KR018_008992 [Drosophila ironensis]|nr:hypothetical protein KR018_008992 [Drosophila ironensis]